MINKKTSVGVNTLFDPQSNGITLIALIITIIILLILAGISISLLTGENSIIGKAKEAKEKYENASQNELEVLQELYGILDDLNLGNGNWDEDKDVNSPQMLSGMIAVYWDNNGTEVKQTDENFNEEDWYNYTTKKWANAKTADRKLLGMDTKIRI